MGYKPSQTTYLLKFLDLDETIQMHLMKGQIGIGIAYQLANFESSDQRRMLKAIKEEVVQNGNKPIHPNRVARILRNTAEKKGVRPKKSDRGRSHSTHGQLVARNLLSKAKHLEDALREFSALDQKTIRELNNPHFLDIEKALGGVVQKSKKELDRLSRHA